MWIFHDNWMTSKLLIVLTWRSWSRMSFSSTIKEFPFQLDRAQIQCQTFGRGSCICRNRTDHCQFSACTLILPHRLQSPQTNYAMPPYCGCSSFKQSAALIQTHFCSPEPPALLSLTLFLPLYFSELCMLFLSFILFLRLFCWQLVILRNWTERIRARDSILICERANVFVGYKRLALGWLIADSVFGFE